MKKTIDTEGFKATIYTYYKVHKRILPWREIITPYGVVVSELMLQQTQVSRVLQKYPSWLTVFPDFESLAQAPFSEILTIWQGMGYNRRAKYLQAIAQKIVGEYGGTVSENPSVLETFPGIGPATARSIITYIYNIPQVFIETNIRRIYIHHFFKDAEGVSDKQLYPLVEATLDRRNPREWYFALMDYGTYLATVVENPNRKSNQYSKQSKFEGSNRQVRGAVLRTLLASGNLDRDEIVQALAFDKERVYPVLDELKKEGFVTETGNRYTIQNE